jgi:hypothetical protein
MAAASAPGEAPDGELARTRAQLADVDRQLATLLGTHRQLEERVRAAAWPTPEYEHFKTETERLADKVAQTAAFAQRLSSRVRAVDAAQARLQQALALVQR